MTAFRSFPVTNGKNSSKFSELQKFWSELFFSIGFHIAHPSFCLSRLDKKNPFFLLHLCGILVFEEFRMRTESQNEIDNDDDGGGDELK